MLHRNRHKIGIGDGGDKALARKIRVHGNFVEYVPLGLLLMALLLGWAASSSNRSSRSRKPSGSACQTANWSCTRMQV